MEKNTILMKSLLINKHIAGNELDVLYYVNCSTDEIADSLFELLTRVKKHMTARKSIGISDELFEEMMKSTVSNLWKYALKLRDDVYLYEVERISEPPDATHWFGKPVADPDLVIQDFSVEYPYR